MTIKPWLTGIRANRSADTFTFIPDLEILLLNKITRDTNSS